MRRRMKQARGTTRRAEKDGNRQNERMNSGWTSAETEQRTVMLQQQ